MTFSVGAVAQSLADYLAPFFPGVAFYEDPNQQGSDEPCMFLQQRGGDSEERLNGYEERGIQLELVYLEAYTRPDMHRRYLAAAEQLDGVMKMFPYKNDRETALLHTYRREWNIDQDALHYKFELRVRGFSPAQSVPMRRMRLEERVKNGEG